MIADPYPQDLAALDDLPADATVVTDADRLIRAVNRLAQALEQNTLAILHPAQGAPVGRPALAPLPPVQTVGQKPACPFHGPDKVRSSTNGNGGFYCSAQPGMGQPNTNPKGYCTWHS